MPEQEQFHDNKECDRLAGFLRESIDRFLGRLDIAERTSDAHEERVHYEQWVRFCLVTSLVPDVLAAACAAFDFDSEALNDRIPALLERSLTPIPMDSAFIADVMSLLPEHRRMQVVTNNLRRRGGSWTLGHEARYALSNSLCEALDIPEAPEEAGWSGWLPQNSWRSGVSGGYSDAEAG